MASFDHESLCFIGIGAMGKPMVGHLVAKLPADTQIHVFDVSEKAIDEICAEYPGRILKGKSARQVAEKSVRKRTPSAPITFYLFIYFSWYFISLLIIYTAGYHYHHGP